MRWTATGGCSRCWVKSRRSGAPPAAKGSTLPGLPLMDIVLPTRPVPAIHLTAFAKADLMGMTLPRRYGGLNFPAIIFTMAQEIVARADASLQNLFGLQGVAEIIHAFADEELKNKYLPLFCRGEVTGAMALTEAEAGSDLQNVKLKAVQDENGTWRLTRREAVHHQRQRRRGTGAGAL